MSNIDKLLYIDGLGEITQNLNIGGNLNVTETLFTNKLGINTTTVNTTDVLNINGNITIKGNMIPLTDNEYSLGSSSNAFKDVFVGPGSLYINNKKILGELENDADTINITTGVDEHIQINTNGQGLLKLQSENNNIQLVIKENKSGSIELKKNGGSTGNISLTNESAGAIILNQSGLGDININNTNTDSNSTIDITSSGGGIKLSSNNTNIISSIDITSSGGGINLSSVNSDINLSSQNGVTNISNELKVNDLKVNTINEKTSGSGVTINSISTINNNLTVNGIVNISGELNFTGTSAKINSTTIEVEDSLIKLASNNTANQVDIGIYGKYSSNSSNYYTGLFKDTDNKWKLFTGLTEEPTASAIDINGSGYTVGTLVANLEGEAQTVTNGVYLNSSQTLTNKTLDSAQFTGTSQFTGTVTGINYSHLTNQPDLSGFLTTAGSNLNKSGTTINLNTSLTGITNINSTTISQKVSVSAHTAVIGGVVEILKGTTTSYDVHSWEILNDAPDVNNRWLIFRALGSGSLSPYDFMRIGLTTNSTQIVDIRCRLAMNNNAIRLGAPSSNTSYIIDANNNNGIEIVNMASTDSEAVVSIKNGTSTNVAQFFRNKVDIKKDTYITGSLFVNGNLITSGGGGSSYWTLNGDKLETPSSVKSIRVDGYGYFTGNQSDFNTFTSDPGVGFRFLSRSLMQPINLISTHSYGGWIDWKDSGGDADYDGRIRFGRSLGFHYITRSSHAHRFYINNTTNIMDLNSTRVDIRKNTYITGDINVSQTIYANKIIGTYSSQLNVDTHLLFASNKYIKYYNYLRFYQQGIGDTLTLHNNGNIGIRNTNPQYTLHVNGNFYARTSDNKKVLSLGTTTWTDNLTSHSTRTVVGSFYTDSAHSYHGRVMIYSHHGECDLWVDGTVYRGQEAQVSDDRFKSNEIILDNCLSTVIKLQPEFYTITPIHNHTKNIGECPTYVDENGDIQKDYDNWATENVEVTKSSRLESGFIAQDMYNNVPELRHLILIDENLTNNPKNFDENGKLVKDIVDEHGKPSYIHLNYTGIIPYLAGAIKELNTTVQTQATLINNLQNQVNSLMNQ